LRGEGQAGSGRERRPRSTLRGRATSPTCCACGRYAMAIKRVGWPLCRTCAPANGEGLPAWRSCSSSCRPEQKAHRMKPPPLP